MREIKEIVVHCTATPENRDVTVADVRRWHKERGFKDIGYHYLIKLDGTVCAGRPESQIGAHCKGHNAQSIGVAYVGGLDRTGKAKDTRTPMQKMALCSLLKTLLNKYPGARVLGHRDTSPDLDNSGIVEPDEWVKDCPCFDALEEYFYLSEEPAQA